MGAAYTAIKFEGPGHPTWQLAVYNNILLETNFSQHFQTLSAKNYTSTITKVQSLADDV